MFRSVSIIAATGLSLLAAQPSVAKVSVVQTDSPALAPGSTFAWAPVQGVAAGVADPALANPITAERLRQAIEANLIARGYRLAASPATAQLVVSYRVALTPRQEARLTGRGGACGFRFCFAGPATYDFDLSTYTQGTLVLDLVERSSGRLVWRAASDKRVNGKDASPKKLNETLKGMTKSLPPA